MIRISDKQIVVKASVFFFFVFCNINETYFMVYLHLVVLLVILLVFLFHILGAYLPISTETTLCEVQQVHIYFYVLRIGVLCTKKPRD